MVQKPPAAAAQIDSVEAASAVDLSPTSLAAICLCFVLSGVAALIYQTAWTRQFALVFGTSELAVATVLAAYMGGLALGAVAIERLLPRIRRPVRVYAVLELGIAAAAVVLIPAGLALSQRLLIILFGGQPQPPSIDWGSASLYFLLGAIAVLVLPTALMGATLPLLVRYVVRAEHQIARRVGLLYASNTAGAVAGALLAALLLLPTLGLQRTIWSAAALNLLAAALAVWRSSRSGMPVSHDLLLTPTRPKRAIWAAPPAPVWVLPLMFLSGAVSFLHEVLWTRILSHVLGSSIYSFGVMVASFLAGIAIGGATGARLGRTRSSAIHWLALAELAVAAATAGAWFALQHWIPSDKILSERIGFGLLILLPLGLAIGLTYPLAVRVLAADVSASAPASARVYGWNTAGAIVGALTGGFLLIPALRYEGSVQLAFIASCALALAAAVATARPRVSFVIAIALPAVVACLLFQPAQPTLLLLSSPLTASGTGVPIYYGVGRSATVAVLALRNMLLLRVNGLPEAAMTRSGGPPNFSGEMWMPALAVLARPATSNMLMVGYGGGRTVEAVPASVRSIDVIELEPKVMEANHSVRELRSSDPLLDARVNIILNDARSALSLSSKRYDAIVSQPSHPWTAGASHLYTREFMRQAHSHLKVGGVFVQWLNIEFLDAELLRSLLATLGDVFDQVRLYRPDFNTVLFIASDAPIEPERNIDELQASIARSASDYLRLGIGAPEDLIAALALESKGARALAQGAVPITDDTNRLATTRVFDEHKALKAVDLERLLAPYDPLRHGDSFIYQELRDRLDFGYIARRFSIDIEKSSAERIRAMAANLPAPEQHAYLELLALSAASPGDAAVQRFAAGALLQFPHDDVLRFEYIRSQFGRLADGTAPAEVQQAAALLGEEPASVLTAASAAGHQQWDKLAALDSTLAKVPLTAPWSSEATQLRVEWRTRVLNPELRPRFCAEALTIIDQAALLQPSAPLWALRAWAGVGLQNSAIALESVSSFARTAIDSSTAATDADRSTLNTLIPQLQELMNTLPTAAGVDHARWVEVQAELSQAGLAHSVTSAK